MPSLKINAANRLKAFQTKLPEYSQQLLPLLKLIATEGTFKLQPGDDKNEVAVIFSHLPAYIDPTIMKRLIVLLTKHELAIGIGVRNNRLFFVFKDEEKLEKETGAKV